MEDKQTLSELREKYFLDRRWEDLADVLEREIPVTDDREERLELYELLGSVYAEHLHDAERAFDAFKTVIDLNDWSAREAMEVWEQLLEIDPAFDPAFRRIEEHLRSLGTDQAYQTLAGHYIDRAEASVADPEAFLTYQREAAQLFEYQLTSPESALVVLTASVTPRTWQTGVLDDIERLAAQLDDWREAIATVQNLLGEMTDGPRAGRLHKRVGFWLLRAGRADDAAHHLRAALRHAPADRELEEALEGLYRQQGRWDEMIEAARRAVDEAIDPVHRSELRERLMALLEEAAGSTRDDRRRGQYLAELGTMHDVEMGDRLTAVRYWEQALNAEPKTLDAARPLIDHYMSDNRWERAAPVLETVVETAEKNHGLLEPRELNQRYLQYGKVCDTLGNEKLALHAYRQAYEIDRNNPRTLERLGLLLFDAEEYDQAYHVFVALADRHERAVQPEILLEVLRKAARIKHRHGDHRVAIGLLERALRLRPDDRPTLRLMATFSQDAGEIEHAMKARKKLIDSEPQAKVQFAELVKMGDAWAEEAGEVEKAARAYVEALELQPQSVAVLRKLLDAFRNLGRWREAIGVLERLVEHEDDRVRRANLYYTMGVVARDEVEAPERAVGYYEKALDENPDMLKAFEAIDRIMTDARAWKDLERAYRRMLHRVTENERELPQGRRNDLNFLLWTSLGEVYRSRLGDPRAAVEAFEAALALRPDDDNTRMILAELYERTGANPDVAIEHHRALLDKDPGRSDSYHALYRAYMDNRRFDAAWCVAGVLAWMQKANPDEGEFYRKYLGWNIKLAKSNFYPELFNALVPRQQSRLVNGIMAHLAVALRGHFAHPVRDFGVNPKKDRVNPHQTPIVAAQMYKYICRVMGFAPEPHLYIRRDHPLGIRILNAEQPSILLGSDLLEDREDDRHLAFRFARIMTWMRTEYYLAAIGKSPAELQLIFVSAADWAAGRKPTAGRDGAAIIKQLKSSEGQTQMQLQSLLRNYLQHSNQPPDMAQWLTLADHTASRVGLVLCNDLDKAVTGIKRESQAPTTASVPQRVENLARFAGSEAYIEIRRELGLAIG